MRETSMLIAGILSIIHPELYHLGQEAWWRRIRGVAEAGTAADVLQLVRCWSVPFTALSVIVNRATPLHRDISGRNSWYDLMLTVGDYTNGLMRLPGLGVEMRYNPGTMVALCGKAIQHSVESCNGDRGCIAYYMRDAVMDRLGLPAGTWANRRNL